jgi:hypothetical protein
MIAYQSRYHPTDITGMDLFVSELLVLSERMRSVLERHRLGETEFFEVRLFDLDGSTRKTGRWFVLSVRNVISTLAPVSTQTVHVRKDGAFIFLTADEEKGPIPVREIDTGGLDLWLDPRGWELLFMSKILIDDLDREGLADPWAPKPVAILG